MTIPYPTVTDESFNQNVTITSANGSTSKISPYQCALPKPAVQLAGYLQQQRADLDIDVYEAWPQPPNVTTTQSEQVPAYRIVAKSDGFVYDETAGQYSPTLAGPLLRYCQQKPESEFLKLFDQWYPAH
jgi:hypothetical protein